MHKMANRWSTVSKTVIFAFLALLMVLEVNVTEIEKTQNQLTYRQVPSCGEILNQQFSLPIALGLFNASGII